MSDFSTDPFRTYPHRPERDPAMDPLERIKRARLRLNLADAARGEARRLLDDAINIALDLGVPQVEVARESGYSRETIRQNRREGEAARSLARRPLAETAPDPSTVQADLPNWAGRARGDLLGAVEQLRHAARHGLTSGHGLDLSQGLTELALLAEALEELYELADPTGQLRPRPQTAPCRHCGQPLRKPAGRDWEHTDTGAFPCDPTGVRGPFAAPADAEDTRVNTTLGSA
ncbi:hypothetical protein DZF91_12525 [Actinomadura logoneensis]|uniref:Uncharacterized protein n=1 Tax=Actinomadura logoneensis TaxID=2293572 RepID=A0A372JMQ9_9ACTN|nr:hypothetical protein [Actinomadura logoneensis]RFU41305.1 hypothetical protein DZF91_12525 [Actinomadura logoneensis]